MCASEVHALLDHNVLPHYLQEVLGGKNPKDAPDEWDKACQEHAGRLGLQEHWLKVHFPFSLSLDNARVHTQSVKTLMVPRVSPAEEATQLHEQTKSVLGVTHLGSLAAMLRQAFRATEIELTKEKGDAEARRQELAPKIGPFGTATSEEVAELARLPTAEYCNRLLKVYGKFRKTIEKAEDKDAAIADFFAVWAIGRQAYSMREVLHLRSTEPTAAKNVADRILKQLEDKVMSNVSPEIREQFLTLQSARMLARRQLACQLPAWRCILPHQLMPLAVSTPDLHAPAEVGVRCAKAPVKKVLEKTPSTCPSLLKAATYQRAIQRAMDERHAQRRDRYSARRCIDKLLCTAKIIAAEAGTIVQGIRYTFDLGEENYVPPAEQYLHQDVRGTGGGYVTDSRFS